MYGWGLGHCKQAHLPVARSVVCPLSGTFLYKQWVSKKMVKTSVNDLIGKECPQRCGLTNMSYRLTDPT